MFNVSKAQNVLNQMKQVRAHVFADLDKLSPVDSVLVKSGQTASCTLHAVGSSCLTNPDTTTETVLPVFSFANAVNPCAFCQQEYFEMYSRTSLALHFIRLFDLDASRGRTDATHPELFRRSVRSSLKETLRISRTGLDTFPFPKNFVVDAADQFRTHLQELSIIYTESSSQMPTLLPGTESVLTLVDAQKLTSRNHFSSLEELAFIFAHQVFFYRGFYVISGVPSEKSAQFSEYAVPVDRVVSAGDLDCIQAFMLDGLSMMDALETAFAV